MSRRVTIILAVALGALVAAEVLFAHHHVTFPWHSIPGFQALLGFGSCVIVVLTAKAIGHAVLQRPEKEDDDGN